MCKHLVERLVRVFWLVYAHNLDLVKLVQTVQTAHVLAIAACLATEASRVGTTLDGEVFLVQNLIAEDVGHRHLCCRDEVEVVKVAMIHLALLVGELSCAVARCFVHHERRLHLKVSALACLIKEECLKSALETCHLTDVKRESGTCDLYTQVKVDEAPFLA